VARAALRPGGGALGRGGAARLRGGGPWEGRSNAKMGSFTGYWGKDKIKDFREDFEMAVFGFFLK